MAPPCSASAPTSRSAASCRASPRASCAANLIGGEEGRGLQQTLAGLELGGSTSRRAASASPRRRSTTRCAMPRSAKSSAIRSASAIRLKLAEMATRCEAAQLLTEAAARAHDRGERCDMKAGMAKYFASEAALENAIEAMRIHGAYGYSKEFPVERYLRDAPLLCIGEGTNEIQRIVIARQLLARNPV
ncbi:MAG TPA: acyl-CoA dehydrogenase family protein [Geminicoccaceae bacterium]|nr:acyl-CoA dehydrogenase family protein [Geminicoccaceae bacterium]